MVDQKPAATVNAAKPLSVLVVTENSLNANINASSLSEQIRTHLGIKQEQIAFYEIKGSRHRVIEDLGKINPTVILYYQTTAGITALYQQDMAEKFEGRKNFIQRGINLRYANKETKTLSLSKALEQVQPLFHKAKKVLFEKAVA